MSDEGNKPNFKYQFYEHDRASESVKDVRMVGSDSSFRVLTCQSSSEEVQPVDWSESEINLDKKPPTSPFGTSMHQLSVSDPDEVGFSTEIVYGGLDGFGNPCTYGPEDGGGPSSMNKDAVIIAVSENKDQPQLPFSENPTVGPQVSPGRNDTDEPPVLNPPPPSPEEDLVESDRSRSPSPEPLNEVSIKDKLHQVINLFSARIFKKKKESDKEGDEEPITPPDSVSASPLTATSMSPSFTISGTGSPGSNIDSSSIKNVETPAFIPFSQTSVSPNNPLLKPVPDINTNVSQPEPKKEEDPSKKAPEVPAASDPSSDLRSSISAHLAKVLVSDISQVSQYVTAQAVEDQQAIEMVIRKAIHDTREKWGSKLSESDDEDNAATGSSRSTTGTQKTMHKEIMRMVRTRIRQRLNEEKIIEIKKRSCLTLTPQDILVKLLRTQCSVFNSVIQYIERRVGQLAGSDTFPCDEHLLEIANSTTGFLMEEVRKETQGQFEISGAELEHILCFITEEVIRRLDNAVSVMLKLETIQTLSDAEATLLSGTSDNTDSPNPESYIPEIPETPSPSSPKMTKSVGNVKQFGPQSGDLQAPVIRPQLDGKTIDLPPDLISHGLSALSYKQLTPDVVKNAEYPLLAKRHSYRHLLKPNLSRLTTMVNLLKKSVEEQIIEAARATAPPRLVRASMEQVQASKQDVRVSNVSTVADPPAPTQLPSSTTQKAKKKSEEEEEDKNEVVLKIIEGSKQNADKPPTQEAAKPAVQS